MKSKKGIINMNEIDENIEKEIDKLATKFAILDVVVPSVTCVISALVVYGVCYLLFIK